MISNKQLHKIAESRPDMCCIFQMPYIEHPKFTVYRTVIICTAIDYCVAYNTTELREGIIRLEKNEFDLNAKIKSEGYDPEDNVIHSFFIDNTPKKIKLNATHRW